MPNKTYALEWLELAFKNLEAARILNEAEHFTDVIGVEVHQAIEKMLKSVLAYHNFKIPRTHDLIEILSQVNAFIKVDDIVLNSLTLATDYYTQERYPNPVYSTPPREEISSVIDNTFALYNQISEYLK